MQEALRSAMPTWHVAANAICQTHNGAITISDGADAVQSAGQPHPVVCMEWVSCASHAAYHCKAGIQQLREELGLLTQPIRRAWLADTANQKSCDGKRFERLTCSMYCS